MALSLSVMRQRLAENHNYFWMILSGAAERGGGGTMTTGPIKITLKRVQILSRTCKYYHNV